jgi:hypothetical protein
MLPVAALPAVLTPIVTGVGYLATVRLLARGASNPEAANLAVEVSGD